MNLSYGSQSLSRADENLKLLLLTLNWEKVAYGMWKEISYIFYLVSFIGGFLSQTGLNSNNSDGIIESKDENPPTNVSFSRKIIPSSIRDGDWFPNGSKIVFGEITSAKTSYGIRNLQRIFIMNSDGTNKIEISFDAERLNYRLRKSCCAFSVTGWSKNCVCSRS